MLRSSLLMVVAGVGMRAAGRSMARLGRRELRHEREHYEATQAFTKEIAVQTFDLFKRLVGQRIDDTEDSAEPMPARGRSGPPWSPEVATPPKPPEGAQGGARPPKPGCGDCAEMRELRDALLATTKSWATLKNPATTTFQDGEALQTWIAQVYSHDAEQFIVARERAPGDSKEQRAAESALDFLEDRVRALITEHIADHPEAMAWAAHFRLEIEGQLLAEDLLKFARMLPRIGTATYQKVLPAAVNAKTEKESPRWWLVYPVRVDLAVDYGHVLETLTQLRLFQDTVTPKKMGGLRFVLSGFDVAPLTRENYHPTAFAPLLAGKLLEEVTAHAEGRIPPADLARAIAVPQTPQQREAVEQVRQRMREAGVVPVPAEVAESIRRGRAASNPPKPAGFDPTAEEYLTPDQQARIDEMTRTLAKMNEDVARMRQGLIGSFESLPPQNLDVEKTMIDMATKGPRLYPVQQVEDTGAMARQVDTWGSSDAFSDAEADGGSAPEAPDLEP